MSARHARRPAYMRPKRPRKKWDVEDYPPRRSGRHLAFRWWRFVRVSGELMSEFAGLISRRVGFTEDRSRPKLSGPNSEDDEPRKPSVWPKLVWRTVLIAIPFALYYGFAPVRHVVDATYGAAYDAILEEINSQPQDDEAPPSDEPESGLSIAGLPPHTEVGCEPLSSSFWHDPA